MEIIKIIFFAIGTFFGIENSQIAAEKTTVTINPIAHTIVVVQEQLFSITKTKEDSLRVSEELLVMIKDTNDWRPELKSYASKSYEFYESKTGYLNAKISLTYGNDADLKPYAIDLLEDKTYSIINIPRWDLRTNGGKINGNYWHFDADTIFEFTVTPFKEIPAEYKIHKKSLLPIWKAVKK